ncbi:helix-turn-helix domain-containing protein [Planctomycetota bacterium]
MAENFADRLQKIRKSKQLSQSGLANKIGLKPAAVSHFETGQRKPPFETLIKLADALSVSIDYLCGRDVDRATTATGKLVKDFERLSLKDQEVVQDMVQVLLKKNPMSS